MGAEKCSTPAEQSILTMHRPLGIPEPLYDLLHDAGWDCPYVGMVELGGRGVYHPVVGWVSVEELRELAEDSHDV